ncbi:hypothetical protein B0H16DRAFT_1644796 [Mycena metata]|uniref:Uncharacterized protein n=1 Tax=Mycena metata TaxID=1033252 RepID=A0AAD7DTR2_9AGAR|nr:hypothetical protein B0H16DRAFT_1644796 [Mycena metata]
MRAQLNAGKAPAAPVPAPTVTPKGRTCCRLQVPQWRDDGIRVAGTDTTPLVLPLGAYAPPPHPARAPGRHRCHPSAVPISRSSSGMEYLNAFMHNEAFIKAALPLSVRRRAPLYPHPTTSKFVRAEDGVRTRSHPARTIDSTQAWPPSYTPPQRWLPSRRRVQGGLMDGGEASEAEACLARMASHTTPFGTGSRLRVCGGVNLRRACSSLCCRPGIASYVPSLPSSSG